MSYVNIDNFNEQEARVMLLYKEGVKKFAGIDIVAPTSPGWKKMLTTFNKKWHYEPEFRGTRRVIMHYEMRYKMYESSNLAGSSD